VLCITHLPQIAARGTTQFLIEKRVRGHRTVTSVERLELSGRIDEIARMIGGAAITDGVRSSARELLDAGVEGSTLRKAGQPPGGESESRRKGESESRKRLRGV